MTSTGEFVLLAPASHIIASDFIKLHLLHALLKSLGGGAVSGNQIGDRSTLILEVGENYIGDKTTPILVSPIITE